MSACIDLSGQKFGKYKVISRVENLVTPSGCTKSRWKCLCEECGNTVTLLSTHLKKASTKPCQHRDKILNEYKIIDGVAYVKLINSDKVMLCDAEDWEKYKYKHLTINSEGYAVASFGKSDSRFFHQVIIDCPHGFVRDHINREKLDNRKSNIRVVTETVNNRNKGLRRNNKSGAIGVRYGLIHGKYKWSAEIGVNGKGKFLGYYDTFDDALNARKEAEIKYGY